MPSHARILIVDDTPDNLHLLTITLQTAGYKQIKTLQDSSEVIDCVLDFAPDIILLDLMMGPLSGYDILNQIHRILPADSFLPILVITADGSTLARERALRLGATDFVQRPHQSFDVILRVRNLLQARFLHLELMARNESLEAQVEERTQHLNELLPYLEESKLELEASQTDLRLAQLDIIDRLAVVGEHHDDDTGAHTYRVAHTSRALAQRLGLPDEEVEMIHRAAPLHDVGKIGISDIILLKKGKLTPEEFNAMKEHCKIGEKLLSNGRSELLKVAQTIAISHHERYDGSGYPYGLQGEAIPLVGRIVAVADVFDALTSERPYKKAWPVEEAIAEIARQSGKQFDPAIVTAFGTLSPEERGGESNQLRGRPLPP